MRNLILFAHPSGGGWVAGGMGSFFSAIVVRGKGGGGVLLFSHSCEGGGVLLFSSSCEGGWGPSFQP
jgi:hypothetical protein